MNGKLPNGGPVMQPTTNGRTVQPAPIDKSVPQSEASGSASRAYSWDFDSAQKAAEPRGTSGERSSRDDGYFASVFSSSEVHEGYRTTKVSMGALNTTENREKAQKDFIAPAKNSSETANSAHPQASDPGLQVPNSSYRVSSPPAFNHSSPPPNQHPYRLQHRHTLEVPKLSTARTHNTQNSTDDVVSASGRFSPNTPTRRRGSMSLARRATRSIHSDMHLEEVPQDEDAARWAEHIRQKRASKRKRKEDEDDDRVVVGTKVDQNHVNWVTAYNMLTGIRFCVSRTNAKMDRDLTEADFDAKHKFSFDMLVYIPF
jgi:1-phosphatidylinositol-4-phosphate 5-kinase